MNSLLKHATPNVPNGTNDMDDKIPDLICWAIWLTRLGVNPKCQEKNLNSIPLLFGSYRKSTPMCVLILGPGVKIEMLHN